MYKTIFQLRMSQLLTLLLTTLLMTMGWQLGASADSDQMHLQAETFKDLGSLAVKLQDSRAGVSKSITMRLSADTQTLLAEYDGVNAPAPDLQKALLADLNQLIQAESLYDSKNFTGIERSEQTQVLLLQNPKSGVALIRLNRFLLADAYPYELASPLEEHPSESSNGVAKCRENLRQIKRAFADCQISNTNGYPQWLSKLVPEYLDEKVLLCPADVTAGYPGVLTEGASDPILPSSYLYEFRAPERIIQEILRIYEGEMTPIIRCEHHHLNLSIGGKLYRSGPQRTVYTNNKTEFSELSDFLHALRAEHGETFLKIQEGREAVKQATEALVINKWVPKMLSVLEQELYAQLEAQLGKVVLESAMGMDILKQVLVQMKSAISEKIRLQLEAQLGAEFFKTQEGQDILQQLSAVLSP